MLSGHLNCNNVAEAISIADPFGVDVCAGVKRGADDYFCDQLKCFEFVEAVRQAELHKIAALKGRVGAQ